MDYPQLAAALLQSGDTPASVIEFLRREYGLAADQAKAAIILAEALPANAGRSRDDGTSRPRAPRTTTRSRRRASRSGGAAPGTR
jgi:hypothetical protein